MACTGRFIVMSLRISPPTLANASPSVALEKGAYYRTRGFHKNGKLNMNFPDSNVGRRRQPRNFQNVKLIALLLLSLACLTCFGMAYYLFKTRWETQSQGFPRPLHADMPSTQVNVSIHANILNTEERFLAYLPHSGFHNQRIAFENALVLARLLNRTLIMPPVRLSNKPIPYYPFHRLSQQLALASKTGLGHCARVPPKLALPPECLDYFDSTFLPWDSLLNLTSVQTKQKLHVRWNFEETWITDFLGIPDEQALYFRDRTLYQYRFVDNIKHVTEKTWYAQDLDIDFLAQQTQKLLFFGTLFGSTRLRLREDFHRTVRKEIREAMMIVHPTLEQVSESIFRALGGAYLAIHLRASEAKFRASSNLNAQILRRSLLNCFFNVTSVDVLKMEEEQWTTEQRETISRTTPHILPSGHCIPLDDKEKSHLALVSRLRCHPSRINSFKISSLGPHTPILYVATDLKNPHHQPLLDPFRAVFPCIFTLSDFKHNLTPLNQVINRIDGIPLRPHLLPFVDALVAGKAQRVVGTKGSTFSYYIEDILWRRIHRLPIKERG